MDPLWLLLIIPLSASFGFAMCAMIMVSEKTYAEAVHDFARAMRDAVYRAWGVDPAYFFNSEDKTERELAKREVCLLETIDKKEREFIENEK